MKRRPTTVLLLSVGVAACGGGGGGPKIALRFHPPVGAVYHYGLEQRTQLGMESGPLAAMGKQQVRMRGEFTQTVKGPASGGGTEVEVVFESFTMEIPGVAPDVIARELAKMNGLRSTVVYDERGQIVRSDFAAAPGLSPDVANQMATSVRTMTFGFPEQPVGRGDSWTVTTELPLSQVPGANASQAGPAKTTLTVREFRIAGSDTSVVIDIKTAFPSGPIQLRFSGQAGTLKLDGELRGHQQFSISRGAILDGTIKGTTKMHVTTAMFGSKGIDMTSDTESSIVLLPEP
jgi:hypothetical protein